MRMPYGIFRVLLGFARGCFYFKLLGGLTMARKNKEPSVRFFTADGVEVETILDLAGPHKDELVTRVVEALARHAARRDFLAERGVVSRQA
ncbi:hypothetical protein [Mesorhizobium sp. WSM3860]|uniref:hypothetical protein n=1 Tax=Mesorhizobium sp. WSM3860 TaxID=2029403 RepID=UPI001140E1B5|nr:hypothetical protein [Mesorhizobium sp. WSM3860]